MTTDLSTATLSDALDRLAIRGTCLGVRPLDPGMRLAGPAFTLRMLPVGDPPGTVGDYVDDVPAGHVVVIDNRGRLDATVWGDLLTTAARGRGVAGTVIDGVSRDSRLARELDYPIFHRGPCMRTGKARVELAAVGRPVVVAGVLVEPGDLIVGDTDGVVVVPASRRQEVEAVAREIEAAEEGIRRALGDGRRLADARARVRYHRLQDEP